MKYQNTRTHYTSRRTKKIVAQSRWRFDYLKSCDYKGEIWPSFANKILCRAKVSYCTELDLMIMDTDLGACYTSTELPILTCSCDEYIFKVGSEDYYLVYTSDEGATLVGKSQIIDVVWNMDEVITSIGSIDEAEVKQIKQVDGFLNYELRGSGVTFTIKSGEFEYNEFSVYQCGVVYFIHRQHCSDIYIATNVKNGRVLHTKPAVHTE